MRESKVQASWGREALALKWLSWAYIGNISMLNLSSKCNACLQNQNEAFWLGRDRNLVLFFIFLKRNPKICPHYECRMLTQLNFVCWNEAWEGSILKYLWNLISFWVEVYDVLLSFLSLTKGWGKNKIIKQKLSPGERTTPAITLPMRCFIGREI